MTRRARLTAGYGESFETGQSVLAERLTPRLAALAVDGGRPGGSDGWGDPLAAPEPIPIPDGALAAASNEAFRQRRLTVGLERDGERLDYRLEAFRIERDFDLGSADEAGVGVGLGVLRRLNRRTTLDLGASYGRTRFDTDDDRADDVVRVASRLTYDLSRTALVTLGHDLIWRESSRDAEDRLENAVFVRLRKEF